MPNTMKLNALNTLVESRTSIRLNNKTENAEPSSGSLKWATIVVEQNRCEVTGCHFDELSRHVSSHDVDPLSAN